MRGGTAKNRKIVVKQKLFQEIETRKDELGKTIPKNDFEPVILSVEKPKIVWVRTFQGSISPLQREKTFPIAMNASSIEKATEIDYLITNIER